MAQNPRVSILLATYNEKETIQSTLTAVFDSLKDSVEVVVIDDDSPDGTWRIAETAALANPRIRVIRRMDATGLASALCRGISEARGEIIGWFDCDMGSVAVYLPEMLEKLSDHDVVIGSRYVPEGADERSWFRAASSSLINRFATLVLGYGIRDYDSGFIVLRRSVFDQVTILPEGFGEYFIEFIYACCRKGLRVLEMPYVLRERDAGISKSASSPIRFLKIAMGYGLRILAARLRRIE